MADLAFVGEAVEAALVEINVVSFVMFVLLNGCIVFNEKASALAYLLAMYFLHRIRKLGADHVVVIVRVAALRTCGGAVVVMLAVVL